MATRLKLSRYLIFILSAIGYLSCNTLNIFGQTTYIWNGSNSSSWNNNLNWTPNTGFPLATDNATINSSGNSPLLDASHTVANFTIASGTLDLNAFDLTVSGIATFTNGNINNGTISPTGASATFSGTIFGADIAANCATILLNGGTFNGTTIIEKNGAANNNCTGNCIFNGITTIINSSTGWLRLSNTTRDIFNADVTFSNTGTDIIYPAYNDATGTQFNGNIFLNSTGTSTGIRFGQGTGTATLANSKTISIGSGGFSAGNLYIRNFTQTGGTAQVMTAFSGTVTLYLQTGNTFNGNVTFTAPQLFLNGTDFNGTATLEKNGATNNAGIGGNTFNGITTIICSGSGYFMLGNGNTDDYNADITFTNTGSNYIYVAYAIAAAAFNGNISINSTGSSLGVLFGSLTGTATLANAKTISIGGSGFSAGTLLLRNFTQSGATSQSLTLTGSAILTVGPSSTFNGDANFTAPQLYLNGCTYNGAATIAKNGATNNLNIGGNIFNGVTTITNSGSGYIRLANTTRDIFNGDATFTNTGTNLIYPAYNDATGTQFNGNIFLNSTGTSTGIRFGQGTGTATLANTKTISIGSSGYSAGNLYIRNFMQTGGTAQTMTTFSGTVTLYLQNGNTFNGNVAFTAPQLFLNGTTYNGAATLEKKGATNNLSTGANVFNGVTTITNSGAGIMYLANTTSDDFNGSSTFIQTGVGALYPAYNTNSTFSGDISTSGTSTPIIFSQAAGGRVIIDGNGAQNFNGTAAQKPVVRRMTMSKFVGGTLTLNGPIDINIDLTMTSGIIITTLTNILTLTDETVTTSIGNTNSYVSGPMAHIMSLSGTSILNFPVGKGGDWRPVIITPTHNAVTAYTYTSEVMNSSAISLGYILPALVQYVSAVRYWQINRTPSINANLTGVTARLYYASTGINDGVTDYTKLTVCKTNGAGNSWIDAGGVATANNDGYIISNSFTSFSTFALGNLYSGFNPLPIELLSFEAVLNNDEVNSTWVTASEINNDYFTVEKSSNALSFEVVGKVKSVGNNSITHTYDLVDEKPLPGLSYYRLKQTDFDGKISYSDIVDVNNTSSIKAIIFPNPFNGSSINVIVEGLIENEEISLALYNAFGNLIYSKTCVNINGTNCFSSTINFKTTLTAGIYYLVASSKRGLFREKLIVSHP